MNVFFTKNCLLAFVALLIPILGMSQTEVRVSLSGAQGSAVQHTYLSIPNAPFVVVGPSHGSVTNVPIPGGSSFDYMLTYTPDSDFTGDDSITLLAHRLNGPVPEIFYLILDIQIDPSQVFAFDDYTHTTVNDPVQINVLANDSINTVDGVIFIKNIPLANNGEVTYSPNSGIIDFTPAPDFSGIAHFNYVVCDYLGSCDEATVSISVLENQLPASDTLRVFTKRNKSQVVLVPNVYILVQGPTNGMFDQLADVPYYVPAPDFDGVDYMLFEEGTKQLVVEVNVLPFDDQVLAFDDQYYTSSYSSIEFNVLENDKFGLNSGCFSVASQPQFGSITEASWPKGTITYQPSPGFSGVDKFSYRINSPLCDEGFETATVYVFVSNFEPAASKFSMSTPKLTPLVIGYNVPIQDFRFQIVDQGELGQVEFFEGQQDVSIYGKEVSGFNLIVYTPDLGVVSGTDEFEIKYCVLDDNNCVYEQSVKVEVEILDIGDGINPSCFGDCIWPGDTNFDGVVNMEDLMPLGLKMGKIGVPRSEINLTQWYGQFGDNWENEIENMELNIKHLDTDGDSIIMGTDTSAISDFYGLTHSLYSNGVPFNQYAIELTGTIFASPGDLIELDMKLGNDNQPAVDVYGFVFPFNYNPDFFVGESVDISFDDNSWLTYNSPVLYMTKNHSNGLSEAGFTRTSGNAASGKGIIGKVQLIIQDDIIGIRTDEDELAINIGGGVATAMNGQGQQFGIEMGGATIHIVLDKEEEQLNKELRDDQLIVYPNPTPNMLNVHLNGGQDFERVVLFTLTGQQVFDSGNIQTNHLELNTQQLTNGIYLLSVHAPNGVINRKVEVLR